MRIGFGAMHFSYDKDSGLHDNRHGGKVGELGNFEYGGAVGLGMNFEYVPPLPRLSNSPPKPHLNNTSSYLEKLGTSRESKS